MEMDSDDFLYVDLERPAKDLDPKDIDKLGQKLSSDSVVTGSLWESVAYHLQYDSESIDLIRNKSLVCKQPEGVLLLRHWKNSSPLSHTLMVLKTALECCDSPDIMACFETAILNMSRVFVHVVVHYPPDIPDDTVRPHSIRQLTHTSTTLQQVMENRLPGELLDYHITSPEGITWQTQASKIKGHMVTITRKTLDETFGKCRVDENIMDNEVSSSTPIPEPNVQPEYKIQNNQIPFESLPIKSYSDEITNLKSALDEGGRHGKRRSPKYEIRESYTENPIFSDSETESKIAEDPMVISGHSGNDSDNTNDAHCYTDAMSAHRYIREETLTRDSPSLIPLPEAHIEDKPSPSHEADVLEDKMEEEPTALSINVKESVPEDNMYAFLTTKKKATGQPTFGHRVPSNTYVHHAVSQLDGQQGYYDLLTNEQMTELLYPYQMEDGWYIIWRMATDNTQRLILSVTHNRGLLHYDIRARSVHKQLKFYIFKAVHQNSTLPGLLQYHKFNNIEDNKWDPLLQRGRPVQMRRPVCIARNHRNPVFNIS